jgi:hypothetical protein
MALAVKRADIERTIELLNLVIENAESLLDINDAMRLQRMFQAQLESSGIVIP